jgi:hypothetical protein
MAIDYDQDIAPLRRQYFPMLVGNQGFDQAMKYREEVTVPMQDRTMKLQSNLRSLQQQKLTFEKYQLDLRKQRDEVRRERDSLAMMPMIEDRMREIRESGAPAVDMREAFTSLAMENIGAINASKSISSMFTFQDSLLKSRASVEAKEAQKKQGFQSTLANSYAQTLLPTGGFDEEVYNGILDGSVGGNEVSQILNDVRNDASSRSSGKGVTPYEVKHAEESLEWARKIQYQSYAPSPDDIKRDPRLMNVNEIESLKATDYRQLLNRFLTMKGIPINDKNARALERDGGYSPNYPNKLMQEFTAFAQNKAIMPYYTAGENSFLTEEGKGNKAKVSAAFGNT